jgi:hypothetical protein
MVNDTGSTSTNTGVAPTPLTASAVAMKVFGTVMTSSPGPIPRAAITKCNAVVPLLIVMQ